MTQIQTSCLPAGPVTMQRAAGETGPVPNYKPGTQRATNEQIIAAYKATGSVWKSAMRLGLCGQSVHERLQRLGVPMSIKKWTREETDIAIEKAQNGVPISIIANQLGRTYSGVACQLSEHKIRHPYKTSRKVKRGIGHDKEKIVKMMKHLLANGISVHQAARQFHVTTTGLVNAIQQKAPELWVEYKRRYSVLPDIECPGCKRPFTPLTKRQKFCTVQCGGSYGRDQEYFGGKRLTAIGLADGICQLCNKTKPHLAAHHVLGKENDPDNHVLIALCRGCHQLVGHLGRRLDCMDNEFWQNLIHLSVARSLTDSQSTHAGTYVTVEIETLAEMEED